MDLAYSRGNMNSAPFLVLGWGQVLLFYFIYSPNVFLQPTFSGPQVTPASPKSIPATSLATPVQW